MAWTLPCLVWGQNLDSDSGLSMFVTRWQVRGTLFLFPSPLGKEAPRAPPGVRSFSLQGRAFLGKGLQGWFAEERAGAAEAAGAEWLRASEEV